MIYLPAVEDVHERNRENVGLLGSSEVGNVSVQGNVLLRVSSCSSIVISHNVAYLLSGTSLGNSQGDTKDGVGTKLALVGSTVKAVQELVDLGLVLDIKVLLDQSGANDGVDVLNSLGDTLATPLGLVAIAKLNSLVLTWETSYFLQRYGIEGSRGHEPVEAPEGTMARCRPVSVTRSTSTVGLPRES